MKKNEIKILDFHPEHQPYFERLYRGWFQKHFRAEPEPVDKFVLSDPEKAILRRGGALLTGFVNDEIAGLVGLKKHDDHTFELTKMVVDEKHRGKGLGEALTKSAIEKARSLGANRIILYSHSSLGPALQMYRKIGFKEIQLERGLYSSFRCNIKMELLIDPIIVIRADAQLAPVIATIGKKSFTDTFEAFFNRQEDLDQYLEYTYSIEKLAGSINKLNNIFYIAMHKNVIAGFIKIKKQSLNKQIIGDRQMELQKIYVLKEYHGTGVAAALLQAALELGKEIQPDCIWLDAIVQNNRAIRFYERNGFKKFAKHYFKIGSQAFTYEIMVMPVAAPSLDHLSSTMFSYGND